MEEGGYGGSRRREKAERTPACNFTEKKKILNLGLDDWLAGIGTRHRFSDQSDIKPT